MGAKDTLQKSEDSITCCLACAVIDKIIDVAIVEQYHRKRPTHGDIVQGSNMFCMNALISRMISV